VLQLTPRMYQCRMHSYPLSVRSAGGQGLSATYYSDSANASSSFAPSCSSPSETECVPWGTPAKAAVDTGLDWSANGDAMPYAQSMTHTKEFAVRWSGFIAPSLQAIYTFQARLHGGGGSTERISLWVDHQQIMSQWTSLGATSLGATVRLDTGISSSHPITISTLTLY